MLSIDVQFGVSSVHVTLGDHKHTVFDIAKITDGVVPLVLCCKVNSKRT